MKLEVGKTYVNRLGENIEIISKGDYSEDYKFLGDDGDVYTSTGSYYAKPIGIVDDLDLIKEYQPSVQPTKPLPDIIDPVINEMCWDMVKVIGSKDWFNELKPALYEALKRYHKEYLDKPE